MCVGDMRSAGNGGRASGARRSSTMRSHLVEDVRKLTPQQSSHATPPRTCARCCGISTTKIAGHRLLCFPLFWDLCTLSDTSFQRDVAQRRQPRCRRVPLRARSPRPRLHTRRCHRASRCLQTRPPPPCAVTAQPARCVATPRPRDAANLRGFPARLSWPPTVPAPTRLHPNPLACPDVSGRQWAYQCPAFCICSSLSLLVATVSTLASTSMRRLRRSSSR